MLRQRIAEARKARAQDDKGFTLIELLIVIVVLGVLAGIVVFGVGTFRADSQVAACKANLKSVGVASQAHLAAKGVYAADIPALVTANYLKAAPPATDLITYNSTTGNATSTFTGCTV